MREERKYSLLDLVVAVVGIATVAVVVYRYKTQGYFDLQNLLMMMLAILGYRTYRTPSVGVSRPENEEQFATNDAKKNGASDASSRPQKE